MSEQFQETIAVSSPESFSININELNQQYLTSQPDHMIVHPMISLPFPPTIEPKDLIVNKKFPQPNGKQSRAPNAFIIYRKAFVKAAREQGYILPMTAISSMASAAWEQENATVKEEYKRIAKDAHKLVKEMFPKKTNQRKRKEKWNLVSFHDKSSNNVNSISSPENNSYEIVSAQESQESAPLISTSPSSSPNLSESDSNISEKSFVLQQQSLDNNFDGVQISNNYLVDSYLPDAFNSFQEYLNSNLYFSKEDYQSGNNFLTEWLNHSENYTFEPLDAPNEFELFDTTSMDDLKNHSQSSLNMTLSEAMGIVNSEGFVLDF
ncbi:hypothetical protein RclHR1_04220009 [Rhizophagus clarus]|uniref:HMG box domain-containing protein n=1 Tax=Rhizophagus clarus TaxID=94130 RepID=A0A2Z6RHQ3_9GLOM|nr:hypothetical protein RclHR1_04220009 [Rhizophagus clarus]GES96539.1 hypothetical protein GLOIN_2v1606344 [Rhizophagus clarus]